ncbi:33_t:CDS:1 [Funneliformis caledonium]|uniref:33_t:CDS:1 n=2 Tax=Funneliformis TaxID=1117308 RepID=A0A9N9B1S1_9GLOM|nr:8571_t:CDS:1 [Funneliformis mosseae]CAG8548534.1 33_t:CDS:1 [Funneliformis caledonium]
MSHNILNLVVDGDNVYCRQHHLETCKDCKYDFKQLNTLHKNLRSINGEIPPPNHINQNLSKQIVKLKEDGNNHFKTQNYNDAIKLYGLAIDMAFQRQFWEPHELTEQEVSVCLSNRSAAYISLEQWVNAYADAEWCIKIKPDFSKGYFRKGKALMGLKRYEEAVHAFEIGLEFEPTNDSLINALEEARKLAGNTDLE